MRISPPHLWVQFVAIAGMLCISPIALSAPPARPAESRAAQPGRSAGRVIGSLKRYRGPSRVRSVAIGHYRKLDGISRRAGAWSTDAHGLKLYVPNRRRAVSLSMATRYSRLDAGWPADVFCCRPAHGVDLTSLTGEAVKYLLKPYVAAGGMPAPTFRGRYLKL